MHKKKPGRTAAGSRGRGRPRTVASSSMLAALAERYSRFRQEHPRGARIPVELRTATLAALDAGVSTGELYKSCGVSWSQVVTWQGRSSSASQAAMDEDGPTDVRVFSVVDAPAVDGGEAKATADGEAELELRLGPWSVTVRRTKEA